MNITGTALKNNRVTYTLLIVIVLLGMASYNELSRDSMPPFTIRVASIVTSFPGASPERIETLITDKIEKVAQEIPEVDFITSESRTGLSVIGVNLKESVTKEALQPVWDRLRRKIDNIKDQLPAGINGPTLKDDDVGVVYGISIGLKNDGFTYAELRDYADDLRDILIKLDDASKVEIGGIIEERVFIEFDNTRLARLGLSSSQLQGIIASTNIIVPAGEINLEGERVILEASGNFEKIDQIKKTIIQTGQKGKTIYLEDIADIKKSYISPRESIVKLNGKEGMALYVSLKSGANIIKLGKSVDKALEAFNRELPVGIEAVRIASQDLVVDKDIDNFISNVFQSIAIVLLVMLMFLGIRTGLVVASLIPSVVIMTLLLMNTFGVGLNQVSLAALIMALGMLVDNAIVVAESMMVRMEKGEAAFDAAIGSCKELIVPLLISSLTTSGAFLAFFLAESVMGEIMGQLFSVITIALLSSWLMALTVVPLLAVAFIKINKNKVQKESIFDKLNVWYNKFLAFSMKHPGKFIAAIVLIFFMSIYLFQFIPFQFMPDSERNLIVLDLNLPLGTDIKTTEERISSIEDYIRKELLLNDKRAVGIESWSSFVGVGPNSYDLGYFPEEQNSGYAHMLINTSSGKDNQYVMNKLEQFCFNNITDGEVRVKKLTQGGGAAVPVQIRISGQDPVELFRIAGTIKDKLYTISGTNNVDDNWGPRIKKFYIDIDQNRLSRSGLTNQDLAVSLKTVLSGHNVGEYRLDDKSIPMIMRSKGSEEISYQALESLNIFSQQTGKNVPLAQLATIVPSWQYAKILRRDLEKTMTVSCRLKEGFNAEDITKILTPWLEETQKDWKNGYKWEFGGESESSGKAMAAVGDKLPLSGFIILLLLVIQFNSIRKTSIILATIPLGLVGVTAGLLMTYTNFSFTAFLGIISLAGIVVNNGIVLIDRIDMEIRDFGKSLMDGVVAACNERFRPILLTTFTTSLGLIPLWIGGGLMWQPMAVAMIFGLLFATVITLVFVPIMYRTLFKKQL